MDPTILKAIIAGSFTLLGGVIGWWFKERKFKAQRFHEREQGFERAQTGYRACYRKFLVNLAAAHGVGAGFDLLQENFLEAKGCNDPLVVEELDEFWPAEIRERGDLPPQTAPASLEAAMRDHGSRTLEEHEALLARWKRRPTPVAAAAG